MKVMFLGSIGSSETLSWTGTLPLHMARLHNHLMMGSS